MLHAVMAFNIVCADDKFSKPFKPFLGNSVYNFTNSMIKENKYCPDIMQKSF